MIVSFNKFYKEPSKNKIKIIRIIKEVNWIKISLIEKKW